MFSHKEIESFRKIELFKNVKDIFLNNGKDSVFFDPFFSEEEFMEFKNNTLALPQWIKNTSDHVNFFIQVLENNKTLNKMREVEDFSFLV